MIGIPVIALRGRAARLALGLRDHLRHQLRLFRRVSTSSTGTRAPTSVSARRSTATSSQAAPCPEGPSGRQACAMLGYLLRQPKIWGLAIGFGAYGYSFYLFLTWLPTYLVSTGGMSVLRSAAYAAMPVGRRDGHRSRRRRMADRRPHRPGGRRDAGAQERSSSRGMLLGLAVVGATMTRDPAWAIFWISISLGGLAAAAPVGWSLPSLIAPKGGVGRRRRHHEFRGQRDGHRGADRDRLHRQGRPIPSSGAFLAAAADPRGRRPAPSSSSSAGSRPCRLRPGGRPLSGA